MLVHTYFVPNYSVNFVCLSISRFLVRWITTHILSKHLQKLERSWQDCASVLALAFCSFIQVALITYTINNNNTNHTNNNWKDLDKMVLALAFCSASFFFSSSSHHLYKNFHMRSWTRYMAYDYFYFYYM